MNDFDWKYKQVVDKYVDGEIPEEHNVYQRMNQSPDWVLGCNDGIRHGFGERERAWFFFPKTADEGIDSLRVTYRKRSDEVRVYASEDAEDLFYDTLDWFDEYVACNEENVEGRLEA